MEELQFMSEEELDALVLMLEEIENDPEMFPEIELFHF